MHHVVRDALLDVDPSRYAAHFVPAIASQELYVDGQVAARLGLAEQGQARIPFGV